MKKNLIICFVLLLLSYAASAEQATAYIHISIQNEYTGALESPLRYGLSTDDFECEFMEPNSSNNIWSSSFAYWFQVPNAPEAYLARLNLLFMAGSYKCNVTINKPGHKLNGLSVSIDFFLQVPVTKLLEDNGIVFTIPK